jgi:hypothetical protein
VIRLPVSLQLSDDNNLLQPLTLIILSSMEPWDLLPNTVGLIGLVSSVLAFLRSQMNVLKVLVGPLHIYLRECGRRRRRRRVAAPCWRISLIQPPTVLPAPHDSANHDFYIALKTSILPAACLVSIPRLKDLATLS